MILYRIASLEFKIFDGTGAALNGARWNSRGQPVIYTATSLAGAKLELLAHIGFNAKPKNYGYVEVEVPDGIAVTPYPSNVVPALPTTASSWGDIWIRQRKTLLARVPSKASPGDFNYMINPRHPDFTKLVVGPEMPCDWDDRHFHRKKHKITRTKP